MEPRDVAELEMKLQLVPCDVAVGCGKSMRGEGWFQFPL